VWEHFAVVLWSVHDDCGASFVCGEDGYIGDFLEVPNGMGLLSGDVGWGDFWVGEDVGDCGSEVSSGCGVRANDNGGRFGGRDEINYGGYEGVGRKPRPLLRVLTWGLR
jgi:hypothetical protein